MIASLPIQKLLVVELRGHIIPHFREVWTIPSSYKYGQGIQRPTSEYIREQHLWKSITLTLPA